MPSFLRKVGRYLGNLFRKQPQAPRVGQGVPGHRGIAARRLAKPDLTSYAERIARGHVAELPADETEAFIRDQMVFPVHSSNVSYFQYFIDTNQLIVGFLSGGVYLYEGVTPQEALQFVTAASKGAKIWDLLRVRGSKTGHRKRYRKIR